MIWIEKEFRFEAAHRLIAPYHGLCCNVHGHSFVIQVAVAGHALDDRGMLMDFQELKPIGRWIDECWDHALLLNNNDVTLVGWCSQNQNRYFVFNANPTSEVMAQAVLVKAKELCPQALGIRISVRETCTSRATIEWFAKSSSEPGND